MPDDTRECGQCHLKFSEFKETGLLGCAACYAEFQEEIDRILAMSNAPTGHSGKRYPANAGAANADVKQLSKELADAVRREAFELAARIRDAIRDRTEHGPLPR